MLRGRLPDGVPPLHEPDAECWFRQCSYCGSMHPEDLLKALEGGACLGGSDWKYGWPHKFYVEGIENPTPDVRVLLGTRWSVGHKVEVEWRPAGLLRGKWYNEHLADDYDDEAFALVAEVLEKHSGIKFWRDGGNVKYRAPHQGYQR